MFCRRENSIGLIIKYIDLFCYRLPMRNVTVHCRQSYPKDYSVCCLHRWMVGHFCLNASEYAVGKMQAYICDVQGNSVI